ncbi:MAG: SDR family NAD(P)-dependent oxidoreductase [Parvibaculaceae bacterium]
MKLKDRTAIVTGAARGIGRACAERLGAEGARVVLADIDDAGGAAAAASLGAAARYLHCDVGDKAEVDRMIADVVGKDGGVDILVNNAGIGAAGGILEISEADFDRVIRVNLKGAFLVGQACARQMVRQVEAGRKPGAIVNMSSVNAVVAIASQVPYSASKGGINQLTKVMALGLADYGIRVNAIGPGSIMTDMLTAVNADPQARGRLLSRTPLGRIGEAAEVAAIAAFLVSDDASYVTGQTIYADGGRLPLNYTVPVKP